MKGYSALLDPEDDGCLFQITNLNAETIILIYGYHHSIEETDYQSRLIILCFISLIFQKGPEMRKKISGMATLVDRQFHTIIFYVIALPGLLQGIH